jgi:hypothetical protein
MIIPPQALSASDLGIYSQAQEGTTEDRQGPCDAENLRAMGWRLHCEAGQNGEPGKLINRIE